MFLNKSEVREKVRKNENQNIVGSNKKKSQEKVSVNK